MKKRIWLMLGGVAVLALLVSAVAASTWTFGGQKHNTWLGIQSQSVDYDIADAFDLAVPYGVIVNSIISGSPAEAAGLKEGDVILAINGVDVTDTYELDDVLLKTEPGETVSLKINRKSEEMTVDVTVEKRPDRSMRLRNDGRVVVVSPDGTSWTVSDNWSGHKRGYLGVSLIELNDQLAEYFGTTGGGALVSEVSEDSPAEKAGIKAGDIIVEIADERVYEADDVSDALEDYSEGDEVTVEILRKGTRQSIQVKVGETVGDYLFLGHGGSSDIHIDMPDIPDVPEVRIPNLPRSIWSDADRRELREELRDAQREIRKATTEAQREAQKELQEALKELQEEMKELRKKLD